MIFEGIKLEKST